MKIAMLIWSYWPGLQGGSERQARLIAHELVGLGVECEVFTARTAYSLPSRENDGIIPVIRLGSLVPVFLAVGRFFASLVRKTPAPDGKSSGLSAGGLRFWISAPWTWLARLDFILTFVVRCILGKVKCDIIHLHEPSWLGGVAQFASRWIGCEVLCQEATSPAMPVIGYDTPFRRLWARLRQKPYYIGMADYTVEQLIAGGIPRERIYLLPSGVKVPSAPSQEIVSLNCLYVANFSQGATWKAFDILFGAWSLVVQRIPGARLYCIGGGDSSEWQKYVEGKGASGSVIFTGTVKDIEPYFAQSSVFILPSRVEGMSNALLEAQMWGLACVVSDIPGNKAVVMNEINGLVVPVNQAQALADAIVRLLNDEHLRLRLGQAARESAIRKFGIQTVTERLIAVYQDVFTKKSR